MKRDIYLASVMYERNVPIDEIKRLANITDSDVEILKSGNYFFYHISPEEEEEIIQKNRIEYARNEEKIEIAKNMLIKKYDIEIIEEITGLSKEEIEALNN